MNSMDYTSVDLEDMVQGLFIPLASYTICYHSGEVSLVLAEGWHSPESSSGVIVALSIDEALAEFAKATKALGSLS